MFSRIQCFNYLKHHCCQLSTSNLILRNHYDSLGVTPSATQSDIKTAYYKLSMQYHPDKNRGSTDASKKFQDITAAYEVLGNYKLRKLYDKGILHTVGVEFTQEDTITDHPEEKFYRSREKKYSASGKTPIYDFDEWSKAHYGSTFERQHQARTRYKAKKAMIEQNKIDVKNEVTIMALMSIFFVFMLLSYMSEEGYDIVRSQTKKNIEKTAD